MTYIDSPIERCPVKGCYVVLDQSRDDCAREHGCHLGEQCPLARQFARDPSATPPGHERRQRREEP